MKTIRVSGLLVSVLLLIGSAGLVRAADPEVKTVTVMAQCAKYDLKTQDTCQTVFQVKAGDKTVDYYVVNNDLAEAFHPTVCQHPQEVTATGTVKEENGKLELTPTKIEVAAKP